MKTFENHIKELKKELKTITPPTPEQCETLKRGFTNNYLHVFNYFKSASEQETGQKLKDEQVRQVIDIFKQAINKGAK